MTVFGRDFKTQTLEAAIAETAWLRDLLIRWHPAGDALNKTSAPDSLRLCVRNGYLNFYRAGQSIAAVRLLQNGRPQAEIHNKYVYGPPGQGQSYVKLTAEGYPDKDSGKLIQYEKDRVKDWIKAVNGCTDGSGHIGDEKRFVDQIVGKNPNVIDLEMAVPAFEDKNGVRRAPRMDLVALERTGDGWMVVFWEVKRVDDGRARSRGDVPKVCQKQLMPFAEWLENNQDLVAKAYQTVCRCLVEFHGHAKRRRPDIGDLGDGIRAVATPGAPKLSVDLKPRILIDDYTLPDESFTNNKHLEKLRKFYDVQIVQTESEMVLKSRPCR